MCELFAMSSRDPLDVTISLEELARHGGRDGPNRDGWGVAYYDDRDVRLLKEAGPASDSACVRFLEEKHLASRIVVAHIRKATRGAATLANSQPFARELAGRMHVFAHNGDVPGVFEDARFRLGRFRPIGETDSEHAFCTLLARLEPLWKEGDEPERAARIDVVTRFAAELRELGAANFLYSDAQLLIAHGDRRRWAADGDQEDAVLLRAPGLHLLHHSVPASPPVLSAPGVRVESAHAEQVVTMIASVPLSDESWVPLAEGEVRVFEAGSAVAIAGDAQAG